MRAGTTLPPGQSGFVSISGLTSGTGSPHLTDQLGLYTSFPAQAGRVRDRRCRRDRDSARGREDHPRQLRGSLHHRRHGQQPLVRRRLRGRRGPALPARSIPPRDPGSSVRDPGRRLARGRPDRPPRLLHARRAGPAVRKALARPAGPLPQLHRRRQRLHGQGPPRPDQAAGGVRRRRAAEPAAVDGARLARHRRLPRPHRAFRRRPRAQQPARLAPARRRALRPVASDPPARPGSDRAEGERRVPVTARDAAARDEKRAYKRSRAFVKDLPLPSTGAGASAASASKSASPLAGQLGQHGSKMWAIRGKGGGASLFSGPQLGFSIPELFVELELHGPGTTRARRHRGGRPRDRHRPQRTRRLGAHERPVRRGRPLRGAARRRRELPLQRQHRKDGLPQRGIQVPPAPVLCARPVERQGPGHPQRKRDQAALPHAPRTRPGARRRRRLRAPLRDLGPRARHARGPRGGQRGDQRQRRRQGSRQDHLEREHHGGRRRRQHRLLAPGAAPAAPEAVGRAPSLPRHRRGRVEGLPAARTSAPRWSIPSRASSPTGTTRPRSVGRPATGLRASASRAASTAGRSCARRSGRPSEAAAASTRPRTSTRSPARPRSNARSRSGA